VLVVVGDEQQLRHVAQICHGGPML
jgi:hypothetical protein